MADVPSGSKETKMTDTEILDYLDSLTGSYSPKVILRDSTTGRGWRLNETIWPDSTDKGVRQAVENYKAKKCTT